MTNLKVLTCQLNQGVKELKGVKELGHYFQEQITCQLINSSTCLLVNLSTRQLKK